jgi:hypothetical protein
MITPTRTGVTAATTPGVQAGCFSGVKIRLQLVVTNPDGKKLYYDNPDDITLLQLAQMTQSGLMALTGQTIKETGATTQSITGAMTANTPTIEFGTGATAAAFTDYAIQTATTGTNPVTATINAISSNTFTVTATWSNTTGSSVTIGEVAMYVTSTAGVSTNKTYALTHDQFTGVVVSNGGTAAATLTFTWS